MEIDYASEADMPSPRDRIVQRLSLQGVPMDNLEQLQPGLISFVKNNKFRVPELVHAILPSNEEAVLPAAEAQSGSEKAVIHTLEDQLRESMVWLQWLMFEGDPGIALKKLAKMSVGQRGVCGSVWGNNDIAYRCRTCEHDPTCAICVPCFQNGNHRDHDYSVIYTGGGCCDCGDATAWRREGFCSKHKGVEQMQPLADEFANSVGPVLDSLLDCWKDKLLVAETASQASTRSDAHVDDLKKSADGLTSVVVETLLEFCMHSESLLSFVSGRVFSLVGLLDILVRAERLLSDDVARRLHELLLKLLGEPVFKYEFAKVFLRYYPAVVSEGIKECNETACRKYPLLSAFSVQIFTVPTLTPRLVRENNLLAMLLECLGDIFISCAGEDGRLLINKWGNMYETTLRVVEDIRFVMSHAAVPRYIAHGRRDILRTWMRILTFVQGMNPQRRETGLHIEEENDHMHWPFVLCHSIANIHSLLVNGAFCVSNAEEADDEISFDTHEQDFYDQDSLRHAKVGRRSQESSVSSATGWSSTSGSAFNVAEVNSDVPLIPSSVSWVTFECLRTIESWFQVDDILGAFLNASSPKISNISGNNFFALKKTLSKIRKGKSLFKSYSAPLANSKITSSREVPFRQCSSTGRGGVHASVDIDSGRNIGQDTSTSSFDDCSMEGEYTIEPEALRVLSLSDWPDIAYDVSSQDISVHIPLHRILSLLLQKALKKCFSEPTANSSDHLSTICCDFFGHFLGGCHPYGFSAFVMEHPLRIRVFCAEVHAGMWRKNGDAAILSCEWYRSVRWSEQGLELDLFLLQCCAALAPPDCYVKRILERFGLSDYVSLNLERGSEYEPILVQEMLTLIIQIVKERRFSGLTTAECLQRELIYKLAIGDATHSQLVKSLPRDLSKINQIQGVLDKIAVYSNPSGMNQGMYKLKRAYWKELDLYHPRWNSRDLQFAEERFLRFCSASALTTQLPKWTKIYYPLNGVARVATCKTTLQIVRAVLFYAVFTDTSTASRSPDGVVVTALHLLSLALDICSLQRESSDQYSTDSIPILAFSGEEICAGHTNRTGDQSLLSLLVSLMKMRKEKADNFMEAGSFNLPSLIESVLKKFAEIDNRCMTKLQKLAPEVINDVSYSDPNGCKNIMELASDADMRKAKAKERQAAIMEKMRAQQSKFLASISSSANDGREGSKLGQEASSSDVGLDSTESTEDICSLCHDSNSESPLSFLILLQKSRLLSLVDRGSPSWEQVRGLQEEHGNKSKMSVPFSGNTVSSSSGMISPSHLNQLIQNAVNEFAFNGQPREVKAFLEFIRVRFPSVRNIQLPCTSNDTREKPSYSLEMLEKQLYLSIRKRVHEKLFGSEVVKNDGNFPSYEGDHIMRSATTESLLLGKYIAALSKETMENPLTLENSHSRNDEALSESRIPLQSYDGFGPADCDGVHVSSCGHAVHQECLDCYLLSLKERHSRRMVFEGGHIVDPYKGEFLCPVCRGLANSVLPSLPGDSENIFTPSMFSTVSSSDAADSLMPSDKGIGFLRLQEALSLLQSAADVVGRGEILKAFPMQQNGKMKPKVESVVGVLCGMYFPGEQDKISGSARISHSMIMWDTLKYSLICTEIAARCGRTSLTPKCSLDDLYKELKTSSGFILSLLMKFARSTRIKNNLTVLLRLRGIQLFADSICSGVSLDDFPSRTSRGGDMLGILKNVETGVPYPDIQFWRRASDPVLSHDAFSSLMWVLFCLPSPILSCEDSFLSLVHIFYVVCIAQAIITYLGKRQFSASELEHHDCLITDLSLIIGNSGVARQYFISNYMDPSCDIKDMIRRLSFPYLRRCGLLWRLVNSSTSAPFSNGAQMLDGSSHPIDDIMECAGGFDAEFVEVEQLEKMFKIPQLDDVLKNKVLRTLVLKWFHHLSKECNNAQSLQCVLHMTPAVPFKLLHLPLLYQDLLQRYIKQNCLYCGGVQEEPALCLLCGKLCTPNWNMCCRENGCQTHAMACDAGIGVFLLIRKTTILLQRSVRQALWPSPYLDAFGEEDIEMHRGKPLYLNEERYAALTHMVASHGLDRSSKVLRQTTIGSIDF